MISNPSPLELIVGHSHSHWDHIAGDPEMKNFTMPGVTTKFIAPDVDSVIKGYSLSSWPKKTAVLDLGSRKLDIIPIPGHTPDAITVYDRQTGLLLTGDSVYPGRLFIPQNTVTIFKESHKRLRQFVFACGCEIKWVLGCHIEQKKTPFEEYPSGTRYQPDEHVLQLNVSILEDVERALEKIEDGMTPRQVMFKEFSLVIEEKEDEVADEWYRHGDQFTLIA
jgi:hydroxyacylglutathione hydrolase